MSEPMNMTADEVATMAGDIAAELDSGTGYPAAGRPAGRHETLQPLGRCAYCGEPAHTRDHILPRSRGSMAKIPGTRQVRNLRPSCQPCNVGRAIAGHCHVALLCARMVAFDHGLSPAQVMRLWGWMGDMPQQRECRRLGFTAAETARIRSLHPFMRPGDIG